MNKLVISIIMSIIIVSGCNESASNASNQAHSENHLSTSNHPDSEMNDFGDISIEDDHGHAHAQNAHDGHGESDGSVVITHFNEATELFIEFPAFVIGQESPMAAHLTILSNYKPVTTGAVKVTLNGGGVEDEIFQVTQPSSPGIFRPIIKPQHLVKRRVLLQLQTENLNVIHDLGEHNVYPSMAVAVAELRTEPEPNDAISYLKEQQWQVDFAVTQAVNKEVKSSIQATGTLRPRADGEVFVSAISTGHLKSSGNFPYTGMSIERGQLLATITPKLAAGDDLATLKAAMDKASSRYQLAKHERSRLEKLWEQKAIAAHRLHEAETEESVANTEYEAAKRRYQQSTGDKKVNNSGIPVLAPISGVLAQVNAAPGKYVHEGDKLFHIVNIDKLWLESRIAAADIGKLKHPKGAWFTLEGYNNTFNTFELDGKLVSQGSVVDPISRTAPLIFEFNNPQQQLSTGLFANVKVYTGESSNGVVVPVSAVFDDGGQDVVYVMLGGESFQRRVVRLGIRDDNDVEILSGINDGEYIVSRGAYMVRLASASPAEAGHGHAH